MESREPPSDSDVNSVIEQMNDLSLKYDPKVIQKELLNNPDILKNLKKRFQDYTNSKLTNFSDPLDIEAFDHLLVGWNLFIEESKKATGKDNQTGSQSFQLQAGSFPIDRLFSDLKRFFESGVPFTKEDHVNAIFCLHAMEINDLLKDNYQITREVPCFRTDSDQMREEDSRPKIDPKHKARADLLISDSSNLPLFLIELKILQSKDLKDGFEIGADTVAGIGNLKQGKTNAKELLVSAVEQVKSYWNFSKSNDHLFELKIPRYAVLVLPNEFRMSGPHFGYFASTETLDQRRDTKWLQANLCLRRQVKILNQPIIVFQADIPDMQSYVSFCSQLDRYEYHIKKSEIQEVDPQEIELEEVQKKLKKKNLGDNEKAVLQKRERELRYPVEKLVFDRDYMIKKLKNSDLEIQTPSDLKKIPIQVLLKVKNGFDWPRLKNLLPKLTIVYDSKPEIEKS